MHWEIKKICVTCFVVIVAMLWCSGAKPALSPRCACISHLLPVVQRGVLNRWWLGWHLGIYGSHFYKLPRLYKSEYQDDEGSRNSYLGLPLHFKNEEIEANGDYLIQGHHLLWLRVSRTPWLLVQCSLLLGMTVYVQSCFSCVQLFVTLWTLACQAPLSMGFSRQDYWSGLPCLSPGIFLTQGSNPRLLWLLHCRCILYRWAAGGAWE